MTTTSNISATLIWCERFSQWAQPGYQNPHNICNPADHYNPTTLRAEVERLHKEVEELRSPKTPDHTPTCVCWICVSVRMGNEREHLIEAANVIRVAKDRYQEALRKIEYGYSTKLSAAEMASIARQALSV